MNSLVTAIRRTVEDWLPWFDRAEQDQRAEHTERIRLRSIAARVWSEHVIDDYRKADAKAELVIAEARRDDR